MKKILITGASGFVGSRIVNALEGRFNLLTPSHAYLDLTSAKDVESYIQENRPDIVLHLAAISNTGYCEEHPDESYLVNVVSVENLAKSAAKHGAKLVFFSSDQVYNGNREMGPLTEEMPVMPENLYGRHKLLAEQRALELCPECVALRATWMYDSRHEGMPTRNNFVINIAKALRSHTPLRLATREYRGITWTEEVVENITHTFELPGGVYNFGAENTLNTYDTALAYLDMMGHPAEGVIIPDHERFPTHVRNISISMRKAEEMSHGRIRFSNTLEGLARFEQFNLAIGG